jgi:hypothetical protein
VAQGIHLSLVNMKIYDIITEVKQPKPTKRQKQSTKGLNIYGDSEKANSDYVAFKLGQAMASTDGKSVPNIDGKSWHGKKKTIHPYTEVEQQMFEKAAKAVGADYKDLNKGNMKSMELDTTNKVSPVPARKTNKYGV